METQIEQTEDPVFVGVPDAPAGNALEAFCTELDRRFGAGGWTSATEENLSAAIARMFHQRFELSVPVGPHLENLLSRLDIGALPGSVSGEEPDREQPEWKSCFDYDALAGQWQIAALDTGASQRSLQRLQGIFSVLYWRCWHRFGWWRMWLECSNNPSPSRLARAISYRVMMPPDELREQARRANMNVWQMADVFGVTPGVCFYGLCRYVRLEVPYFAARLNFSVDLDQQQLFFAERGVSAEVWGKFLAPAALSPTSNAGINTGTLEPLRSFARRGSVIEVRGPMLHAMRERRPLIWTADRLLHLHLPKPLCFAARPNQNGTQMLLQAVPLGSHALLMDRALYRQQEKARETQTTERGRLSQSKQTPG